MSRDEYATQKMHTYRDKNAEKWAKKYGQSWYNERPVLNAQKRIYIKAWHEAIPD